MHGGNENPCIQARGLKLDQVAYNDRADQEETGWFGVIILGPNLQYSVKKMIKTVWQRAP